MPHEDTDHTSCAPHGQMGVKTIREISVLPTHGESAKTMQPECSFTQFPQSPDWDMDPTERVPGDMDSENLSHHL